MSHVWFWQTPTWRWAEFWALVIVLLPSTLAFVAKYGFGRSNARFVLSLVNGRDGRWSTSKTSVLLWTYALWFAFLTILPLPTARGLQGGFLRPNYLVLSGIPPAAAVTAKGFTQRKVTAEKSSTSRLGLRGPTSSPESASSSA